MTDTPKEVEEDATGTVPIRELSGAKAPDSMQINPATDTAHGHYNHVAINAGILLSREPF